MIGYLLGGWVVAAGTAVLALLILGVALAGTQTTRDRLEQRRQGTGSHHGAHRARATVITHAIAQIEARVGPADR